LADGNDGFRPRLEEGIPRSEILEWSALESGVDDGVILYIRQMKGSVMG
jgi:hypothetical protein